MKFCLPATNDDARLDDVDLLGNTDRILNREQTFRLRTVEKSTTFNVSKSGDSFI